MKYFASIALGVLFLCGSAHAQISNQKIGCLPPVECKSLLAKINPFQPINVNSTAFQNMTAQIAHVASAYAITQTAYSEGHGRFGIISVSSFVIPKEFFFDKKFEKQPFKNNLIDTLFYGAGIGLAVLQNSIHH